MLKSRPHVLVLTLALFAAGCSMPTLPGFGGYYEVTDPAAGIVYFTRDIERTKRGAIEFRDGASGAWVSLARGTVTEIDAARYRQGIGR